MPNGPTRRDLAAVAAAAAGVPRCRLLTTGEAAEAAGVTAACIRQWTVRGRLRPVARRGRENLYREDHVLFAERDCRSRRAS
ncbi:MerR family transcriptional regulator [Kitasatospora sp. NPDC058048]|uniref:MerR family transcriptional regulator n=1 Tax=Kitasatospora sp. NPDC058048 TaxID=3346313 RepID=UPI0036D952F6